MFFSRRACAWCIWEAGAHGGRWPAVLRLHVGSAPTKPGALVPATGLSGCSCVAFHPYPKPPSWQSLIMQWAELKPKMPFGQVPVLEVSQCLKFEKLQLLMYPYMSTPMPSSVSPALVPSHPLPPAMYSDFACLSVIAPPQPLNVARQDGPACLLRTHTTAPCSPMHPPTPTHPRTCSLTH